ncbi:outer membrane protein assembly factor BamA [Oceanidesulfovibrio indonesiensis]|nr:outer membrane protein assembly factor BamA [Oceanidesulfovibrio indonesiensis]
MKCRLLRTAMLAMVAFTLVLFHGQPAPAQNDVTVVVLPFQVNADPKYDYLNASLPELLTQSLGEQGFNAVSQDRVRTLIREQNVTFLDLATARTLAQAAGAQYAVYGSFSQIGESISLDVRLVNVEGTRPATPLYVSQTGMGNLGLAVGELTQKLSDELYAEDSIAEIEVRGLAYLDQDVVLSRLSIREGDPFNPRAMNDEIKRVFDLGYFEDVRVSVQDVPQGKKVIFDLEEKPRIRAIGVVGNDAIDDDEIIEAMNTQPGTVLNPSILADDLEKIRGLYRDKGYYLAEISYELEEVQDSSARLNIVVKETKRLYVTKITLNGVEAMSESAVRGEMKLGTRGIISWLTGTGVLKEELLEHDAAAIEKYYANHGFVDVKVSPAQVDYTEDGIHVSYDIIEGPRYKVGEVSFAGDLLVPNEDLRKITSIDDLADKGEWFDRSMLREDSERLTMLYNDLGYAYAETNVRFNEAAAEEPTLDVTFTMTKNQKVFIRRVTIDGNTKTRDNVIRRELVLADGDLFNGSALQASNIRLENLDLFESYDIETVPTDDPKELDLKVNVKEKATGMISGGLGYGSYDGVFVTAKVNERNLFGRGYFIGLTGSFSGKKTRFDFSFTNPRVYDSYLGFGLDAYYTEESFPDFDREAIGGGVRFSHPIGNYSTLHWGYTLERYKLTDLNYYYFYNTSSDENWSSIVNLGLSRNTTNRNMNPTSGWRNSVAMYAAGGIFGGDDEFIKLITDHNWYYLLPWGDEHIFHWRGQAGALLETPGGGSVPIYQRFYLGGMNSVRGYEGMSIGPRDIYGQVRGGTYQFFTNFEYLFRLSEEFGLQGVAFFDAGDAWGGFGEDVPHLKTSVGAGLRWASPFGLLRVEYGYALDRIPGQGSPHRLEFSMGQAF